MHGGGIGASASGWVGLPYCLTWPCAHGLPADAAAKRRSRPAGTAAPRCCCRRLRPWQRHRHVGDQGCPPACGPCPPRYRFSAMSSTVSSTSLMLARAPCRRPSFAPAAARNRRSCVQRGFALSARGVPMKGSGMPVLRFRGQRRRTSAVYSDSIDWQRRRRWRVSTAATFERAAAGDFCGAAAHRQPWPQCTDFAVGCVGREPARTQIDEAAPVDEAVMHLGVHRDAATLQAVDDVELPGRTRAVEALFVQAAHGLEQLRVAARGGRSGDGSVGRGRHPPRSPGAASLSDPRPHSAG